MLTNPLFKYGLACWLHEGQSDQALPGRRGVLLGCVQEDYVLFLGVYDGLHQNASVHQVKNALRDVEDESIQYASLFWQIWLLILTYGNLLMSLLDPLRMHMTVLPTIVSFIAYNPETASAPAGYSIIASLSYISSMVLATSPQWIKWMSRFNSLRIYQEQQGGYERNASCALHGSTINKSLKHIQNDRLSDLQRIIHGRRSQRLKSHYFDVRCHLMQVTSQPRSQPSSAHTGKNIVEWMGGVPFLKQLSCQSPLPLYHMYIVKGVQEHCISFFLKLPGLCDCIVKTRPHQYDVQILTAVVPHTVDFEFGSGGRHEDSALDLHGPAAVGDSLGMVTRTCSHNSPCSFLLTQVAECSGCPSYLETSNGLQVLPLEIHIGLVLLGKVG